MALLRFLLALVLAISVPHSARAAAPKDIDAAVQKGIAYLKKSGGENGKAIRDPDRVGATALVGLALLEAGAPADDAAVKKITTVVRDASYTQTQTYHITLCLLYLDRLGEPGDRPLIQMLGVRLLAGQNMNGGWTYECISAVPPATERLLRTRLSDTTLVTGSGKEPEPTKLGAPKPADKPSAVGKLHADVEKYRQALLAAETGRGRLPDDNSNTQFGVLGVWAARKHGVPVEPALDLIEKRFLLQQTASGGWPYSGLLGGADGSPSMTCAGLLGLATAIARREEKKQKAALVGKPEAKEPKPAPPNPLSRPTWTQTTRSTTRPKCPNRPPRRSPRSRPHRSRIRGRSIPATRP